MNKAIIIIIIIIIIIMYAFVSECDTYCTVGCSNSGAGKCDSNSCVSGYYYDDTNLVCSCKGFKFLIPMLKAVYYFLNYIGIYKDDCREFYYIIHIAVVME